MDTTTIHFDCPVWDDADLRRDLLDSDEEILIQGSNILHRILVLLNNNENFYIITVLFSDYSLLDLSQQRKFSELIVIFFHFYFTIYFAYIGIESIGEHAIHKRLGSPGANYHRHIVVQIDSHSSSKRSDGYFDDSSPFQYLYY
uniref:Uncharacterized protein n=1 Tax=Heterorhabditis bacteriophora TaxID=37862 RepID=A0A1I7X583_HETBA